MLVRACSSFDRTLRRGIFAPLALGSLDANGYANGKIHCCRNGSQEFTNYKLKGSQPNPYWLYGWGARTTTPKISSSFQAFCVILRSPSFHPHSHTTATRVQTVGRNRAGWLVPTRTVVLQGPACREIWLGVDLCRGGAKTTGWMQI